MSRSHLLTVIGASTILAIMGFPAEAEDENVQQLKEEMAALQKKLNVLEKQVQVNHAQEQAAVQSYETLTSGKDGGGDASKLFGVKITFGGYAALEGVYRNKDEVTSIGSAFQKIPFPNTEQAHVNELRGTAQQSRLSLLAEGTISDHEKWAGYVESDFLGAAPTANSTESNSYTPRLRQFYGTYDNSRDGWHFLAGQSWSLVTMFKSGLIPRQENVPLTIDAQYVPGFDWLRNPEVRIVKDWDKKVWLGIEASSPQAIFGGNFGAGLPAANAITAFPCTSQLNNAELFNNKTQGCTLDFMPDITVKAAVDPGWGHYEIFGLARGFRDRISGFPVANANQNNDAFGFSGGGGAILPIWGDKLQLQANVLYGQGIGRYDAAQLPDFTINPDGSVQPLTGYSIMGGVTSHNAINNLDLYAYAGENHVFSHVTNGTGFGDGANFSNAGCFLPPDPASLTVGGPSPTSTCAGQINDVWQVTGGFWYRLYDGDKGVAAWGMQDSFTVDTTPIPIAGKGDKESASMNVAMMSFRFYPKYGTLIGTKP